MTTMMTMIWIKLYNENNENGRKKWWLLLWYDQVQFIISWSDESMISFIVQFICIRVCVCVCINVFQQKELWILKNKCLNRHTHTHTRIVKKIQSPRWWYSREIDGKKCFFFKLFCCAITINECFFSFQKKTFVLDKNSMIIWSKIIPFPFIDVLFSSLNLFIWMIAI